MIILKEEKMKQIHLAVVYTSNVTEILDKIDGGSLQISSDAVLL